VEASTYHHVPEGIGVFLPKGKEIIEHTSRGGISIRLMTSLTGIRCNQEGAKILTAIEPHRTPMAAPPRKRKGGSTNEKQSIGEGCRFLFYLIVGERGRAPAVDRLRKIISDGNYGAVNIREMVLLRRKQEL